MNHSNDDNKNYRYQQKQSNDHDDNNDENIENQTDDLLDLFSTTMHSLAADAAAIRQITDLADLTGILFDGNGAEDNDDVDDDEKRRKREYILELCDLDQLISGVENKVVALRQIINEENSAITKFETDLREEAHEQADLIEGLMSALELQHQEQGDGSTTPSKDRDGHQYHIHQSNDESELRYRRYDNNDRDQYHDKNMKSSKGSNNNNTRRVLQSRTIEKTCNQSSPHPSKVSGKRSGNNYNNSNDSYQQSLYSPRNHESSYGEEDELSFVKVTDSEIREQTRNVPSFGLHLSRFDLNEALEEIERVVWNKISFEPKNGGSTHHYHHCGVVGGPPPPSNMSSNTLQRRSDYLRQRQVGPNAGFENETEAHVGYRWVSEQELRENCAFFHIGESTARGTLQFLCSLKRLKQVPGKNRERTYLCLFD